MTDAQYAGQQVAPDTDGRTARDWIRHRAGPLSVVMVVFVGAWYAAAVYYNTGALALNYSERGQPSIWNHKSMFRRWGDALNTQLPTLPAPHQIIADLWSRFAQSPSVPGNLWVQVGTTGWEAAIGFLVGAIIGIILAYGFVRSRFLELSLFPYVVMSQTVPILALVPALIVILGVGFTSKVIVAAYLAFYPIAVSTVKGLRSVDPLSRDLMRSYAASDMQSLVKLRMPAALPFIFTGLKIGVTASLIGAIVSEISVGSQFGIGLSIVSEASSGIYVDLWATIVAAGLLGLAFYLIVLTFERLVMRDRIQGIG